jgi:hypothetical protein
MASTIEVDKIKHSSGVAFTLPAADGTAGQMLKTDGNLGLGWVTGGAPTKATIEALGIELPAADLTGTIHADRYTNTTYSVQDGELSENSFTNADHTKLDGIEASATADQTNAEIKTAVEAATSIALGGSPTTTTQSGSDNSTKIATTAYTDAQVATVVDSAPGTLNTLNELAAALGDDANFSTTTATNIAAKLPLVGGAMTGAITTNSTFDGRDVATDGTKLDGIEASADITDTTNVTAAGALMDSELASVAAVKATTGTFLTADQTKLDGIEASATADQTKTDIEALGIELPAADLTGTIHADRYTDTVYTHLHTTIVTAMSANDMDLSDGEYFSKLITGNTTLTFSNIPSGYAGWVLELTNGGSATVTWPTNVKWGGGVAASLTASGVDILVFTTDDSGVTIRAGIFSTDSK